MSLRLRGFVFAGIILFSATALAAAKKPAHPHPAATSASGQKPEAPAKPGSPEAPVPPKPTVSSDSDALPRPPQLQTAPFGDRISLPGRWLFRAGTGPDYASPTLDDSSWETIDSGAPFYSRFIFGLNELWYRTHIHLAPGTRSLALTLAEFGGSYRVYANGVLLGGFGRMQDRGDYLIAQSATFAIPQQAIDSAIASGDLVIAIHAFVGTVDRVSFSMQDGLTHDSLAFLGPDSLLRRDQQAYFLLRRSESTSILTLWIVLFALALALTVLMPRVPAYSILASMAACHILNRILLDFAGSRYVAHTHWLSLLADFTLVGSILAALEFCRLAAGSPRRLWLTGLELFIVLAFLSLIPASSGAISFYLYTILTRAAQALTVPAFLFYLVAGVFRRRQDCTILAAASGLFLFYLGIWYFLKNASFETPLLNRLDHYFLATIRPEHIASLALVLAFLTVVIVRTLRIVRDRASIATEIEAARNMQLLLLGRSSQPTPGFLVENAYLPAGEVGGDFFLVVPEPAVAEPHLLFPSNPALTAILGDVSGKGMRAAMRVSMILGVLRREPSFEPAAILTALNDALLGEKDTGFTTACCVRLWHDGRYAVANAGHIPPYLAGPHTSRELDTPPSLPLGLAPGQTYDVVHGRLEPGQQLVLLSDGIPEARTSRGELYGFDRLPALTLQSASTIASVAQSFGQEDDITVLTIARESARPPAAPPPAPPPASPPVPRPRPAVPPPPPPPPPPLV